jgi:hypothetical protein
MPPPLALLLDLPRCGFCRVCLIAGALGVILGYAEEILYSIENVTICGIFSGKVYYGDMQKIFCLIIVNSANTDDTF